MTFSRHLGWRMLVLFTWAGLPACGPSSGAPPTPTEHGAIAQVAAAITGAPGVETYAALATTSVLVEQNGRIQGGHAAVRTVNGTPLLDPGYEMSVKQNGSIDSTKLVIADSVHLLQNAVVGQVATNGLSSAANATHGAVSSFAAPPALPALLPVTAGTSALTVGIDQTTTIGPGAYGAIVVKNNATLRVTSGSVHARSLVVEQNGRVEWLAAGDLRLSGQLLVQQNAIVSAAFAGATAKDLSVHVHGADGDGSGSTCGGETGPWAVSVVQNGLVRGLVLAPNGTADTYQNGTIKGAVGARQIHVRQNGLITWEDGLRGGTCGSCDDGNPCTTDACSSGTCTHVAVAAGTSCSDGNVCNGAETCDPGGVCLAGTPLATNDNNPCTADACHPVNGVTHTPVAAGTSCGDGDACNGNETCSPSGVCVAGAPPTLNDNNPCTVDACSASGGVTHTPVAAGTSCSACGATCSASGTCVAGSIVIDDGNPCTADSCDPVTGVHHVPLAAGASCANANACDGTETCDGAGACLAGTAPPIDDGNACTADSCDPATGVHHVPVAAETSCADGNVCNGSETCNGAGSCVAGAPPVTNDFNPCTADACDPVLGVTHTPVAAGTACADADVCNGVETCDGAGTCAAGIALGIDDGNPCTVDACHPVSGVTHTPVAAGTACADSDVCNGTETCDPTAHCVAGTPPSLDDANPCTTDACDAILGVTHTPLAAGTSCSACGATCDGLGACLAGAFDADDHNPCTADACDPVTGVSHTPLAAGTSCSDGNACNGSESCDAAATCVAGTAPTIDDTNPCTVDVCDPATGVSHTPAAVGTTCADANACNGMETCDGTGTCVAGPSPAISDGNPCTVDACDPATGVSHVPLAAGASCSNGDACDGLETCDGAGVCLAGTAPSIDDANPCTADACSPATGVSHTPLGAGTSCSNGNACDGAETCNGSGACAAGTAPTIDDGNPCTTDACDPATGVSHVALAAGTSCSNGNACDGAETCTVAAACVAGTPPTVDDGNPCTVDACDPASGVSHTASAAGTSCGDGNACNGAELCNGSGACLPGTVPAIDDGNPCTTDACDPATGVTHTPVAAGTSCSACGATCSASGTCVAGTINLDDGNPCTADACDPVTGVSHTPVAAGTSCSDGDACNGNEVCSASGACQAGTAPVVDDGNPCTVDTCAPATGVAHTPSAAGTSCADANACNGQESCNGSGACVAGTPPGLDDGNPCTTDACDPATGVTHTPVSAGTTCSDGNACNGQETCSAGGTCQAGTAPTVDDGNPCTTDACDPATGVSHTPVTAGTTCSDGNACNGQETCSASGTCQPGTAPVVDDGNPCTTDACNPATGVSHTPVSAGTSCTDGNACNGQETCDGAGACLAGTPPVVDDGNACTTDACDPATGVSHAAVANGTACIGSNACLQAYACQAGACVGSSPVVCTGDACHDAGTCNPATGQCSHPAKPDGTACSDGSACTTGDSCQAGACTGAPKDCPQLDGCHTATCDAATGACGNVTKPECAGALPPDPCVAALPLDPTIPTTLKDQVKQLWSAGIQTGVTAATFDDARAAAIHGVVRGADGAPLPGVTVRVAGHSEYGQTLSRADGQFDLVVNGGPLLTFDFQKAGYVAVQRTALTPWGNALSLDDVVLSTRQAAPTAISFGAGVACQIARGDIESDADGARRGTLIVAPGTTADLKGSGGALTPIPEATVRMTELSAGPLGPQRVSGTLPVESAYGYATELAADEALAANSTLVLSTPAVHYVENVLHLPVGRSVPAASYDRTCATCAGTWQATTNGRVVRVLGVSGGMAALDTNGDEVAEQPSELMANGYSACELTQLAALYPIGTALVRNTLPRLGGWAMSPGYHGVVDDPVLHKKWPATDLAGGCVEDHGKIGIDTLNRRVLTRDPVTGTPYTLVCSSARSDKTDSKKEVVLWDDSPLGQLARIDVYTTRGGKTTKQSYAPVPNLRAEIAWDGTDSCGRPLRGSQVVTLRIGYVYPGEYGDVPKFALTDAQATGTPTRQERITWRTEAFDADRPIDAMAAGCDLDIHHVYDKNGVLQKGDGSVVTARAVGSVIEAWSKPTKVLPSDQFPACDIPVQDLDLYSIGAIAVAPNGNVFVSDQSRARIYRIGTDGIARCAAGFGPPPSGSAGVFNYNGDEIPATSAKINPSYGQIAPGLDCASCFYFADMLNMRVRFVDDAGIIHTVAGNGLHEDVCYVPAVTADGLPATAMQVSWPNAVSVGHDGSVFFGASFGYVGRVLPDGRAYRVAGRYHCFGSWQDSLPAQRALDVDIYDKRLVISPTGELHVVHEATGVVGIGQAEWLAKLRVDGILGRYAGAGIVPDGDGVLALGAALPRVGDLVLTRSGSTLLALRSTTGSVGRVYGIDSEGRLRTEVGGGALDTEEPFAKTGQLAASSKLEIAAQTMDVAPDGTMYLQDGPGPVRRVSPGLRQKGAGPFLVAGPDAREVYEFDGQGRHLRTRDALTKAVRQAFTYDAKGRLASITDLAGGVTTIERTADGRIAAIVAPRGQRTTIGTDATGHPTVISNPAGETVLLAYGETPGLVTQRTEPDGAVSKLTYDSDGQLLAYTDARGGGVTFSGATEQGTRSIARVTAEGATTTYQLEVVGSDRDTRVKVDPDGKTSTQTRTGNVVQTSFDTGNASKITVAPDPRFGMAAPLARRIALTDTSGKVHSQYTTRTATLSTATDPYSLVSLIETDQVGSTSSTLTYTASARTLVRRRTLRDDTLTLDAQGRASSFSLGGFTSTVFAYDAQGHLTSLTQGTRVRSFTYGADGFLATATDAAGKTTTYTRDLVGRPVTETTHDAQVYGYGYDAAGRLVTLTRPGHDAELWGYSPTGELVAYDGHQITYDRDSRVTKATTPAGAITLAYDPSTHLAGTASPDGAVAVSRFGATVETLTPATGEGLTLATNGLFVKAMTWTGDVPGAVALGRATGTKVTTDGVQGDTVSFGYGNEGQLEKAGELTYTLDVFNRQIRFVNLRSTSEQRTYGSVLWEVAYRGLSAGSTVIEQSDTRDAKGRLATRNENVAGTLHPLVYTYDSRGRVATYSRDGVVTSATYDAVGNRTAVTDAGVTTTATFDGADRLLTHGTASYTYDASGRLATKTVGSAVTHYTYDTLGALTRVDLPDGRVITYVLDPLGRRVGKKIDGVLVAAWLYRDAYRPIAELDGAGNVTTRYVYGDGQADTPSYEESLRERMGLALGSAPARENMAPVYAIRGTQALRIFADQTGSVRLVVDATTKAVLGSVDYDPWGRVKRTTGSTTLSLGFLGGITDADTGLVHVGHREYDPTTARFTTPDPYHTPKARHRYVAASGDLVNEPALPTRGTEDRPVLDSLCVAGTACSQPGAPRPSPLVVPGIDTDLPTVPTSIEGNDDELLFANTAVDLYGGPATANAAPTVGTITNFTVLPPAQGVQLPGVVSDDGQPAPLAIEWRLVAESTPGDPTSPPTVVPLPGYTPPVFIDNPADPKTLVTFTSEGRYLFALRVSDGEYTVEKTVEVTVAVPQPTDPASLVVAITGPTTAATLSAVTLTAVPTVNGVPVSGATYAWSVTGPQYFVNGSNTLASLQTQLQKDGLYTFKVAVTAGGQTRYATYTVTAQYQNVAPVVNAGADKTLAAGTLTTSLSGSATDDSKPGTGLTMAWSFVSGPSVPAFSNATSTSSVPSSASSTANVTFTTPGVYTLRLTAFDGEKTGTDDLVVNVGAPAGAQPTVTLSGIADDAVITKPVVVSGTISNGAWALQQRLGGRDDVDTPWTTIASGTGAKTGTLGTFDPTLLVNGQYTIRVVATTTSGETETSVSAAVDGNMKIGLFTLSWNDVDVAVGSLPITLVRTYDSRVKTVGDFGVGWKLSSQGVRIEKSGKAGAYWRHTLTPDPIFPEYCIEPAKAATVTFTMPNGRQYRFKPQRQCQLFLPLNTPSIVWESTTDPGNPTIALATDSSTSLLALDPAPGPTVLRTSSGDPWDPKLFTLTIEDGTKLSFETGKGLTRVEDRVGNAYAFDANGIHHTAGKDILFERDAQKRITKVTDPDGAALTYTYNAAGDLVKVTERTGATTAITYDTKHNITDIVDARGIKAQRNDYDASGRLIATTDADGNQVQLTHNVGAQTEAIRDRLGHVTVHAYDDRGNVVSTTNALGGVKTATYDARDNQLTSTDEDGRTTSWTYDAAFNKTSQTNPMGQTTSWTFNGFGQALTTTDPLGHVTTSVYDGFGNLLSTTDPMGHTTSSTYHPLTGDRLTSSDALGRTTHYAYDSAHRMTTQTDALGHVVTMTYDQSGRMKTRSETRTTPAGTETVASATEYDGNGRVTKTIAADGAISETTYDAAGLTLSRKDPLGRVTSMTYDKLGRQTKTTYPDGTTTVQGYDAEGRRTTRTDEAGHTTTSTYDALGRVTKTTFADGTFTTIAYDPAGQQLSMTDERGVTTTYAYDLAGRRLSTTNPLGETTSMTYDAAGRMTATTDALGHTTTTTYDNAGRVVSTTLPTGQTTTYEYDAAGQKLAEVDALSRRSEWAYDELGRLRESRDQANQAWAFGYDEVGNMIQQTDALGRITRFGFDKTRRQVSRTLPLGMTETFTYDTAGQKSAKKDFNGYTTTYGYDARGRLVAKVPDPAKNEATATFGYTPTGRKEQAANGSGIVRYTYDLRDRMVKKQMPAGTLSYTYDPHGNVATMKSSNAGGVDIAYGWDGANRLVSVTDPAGASTFEYDAAGRMTKRTDPNGIVMTYAYDAANRVLDVNAKRGTTAIADYAYTRDTIGRVTTLAELGGRTVTYGYSQAGRLVGETIASDPHGVNGTIAYTHDPVGNRLTRTSTVAPIPPQTFAYDANDRITTETYDQNGNTLTSDSDAFLYDFEDRLVAINSGVTLAYDAAGNLGSRTEGGTKVAYLVDELSPSGYTQVVEEVGAGVARTFSYADRPLRMRDGVAQRSYLSDGHRDTRVLADGGGSPTDEYTYDSFGVATRALGGSQNSLRFSGERLSAPGLVFLRARHERAALGQFLSSDPWLGARTRAHSLHQRLYAEGEPTNSWDPTGRETLAVSSVTIAVGNILGLASVGTIAWGFKRSLTESKQAAKLDAWNACDLRGGLNGPADAYRHCLAGCYIARNWGFALTQVANHWYEEVDSVNSDPNETEMDLKNTKMGAQFAATATGPSDCSMSCRQALESDELVVLDQLEWDDNKDRPKDCGW